MFDTTSRATRVLAIFVAFTLAVGAAAAAAPTLDDETTNTMTTSDVQDGTTIVGFEANANNSTWIEASEMTADGELRVIDPNSGETVYVNSTPTATDAANGHYAFNVTHDEWDDLPIESGQNKTFTFRLLDNTSADNPDTTNATVYVEGVPGRSVVYANANTLGDDNFDVLTTGFQIETLGWTLFGGEDKTESTAEDVAINGSDSTVTIHYANSTAVDTLDTSVGDLSAEAWSKSTIVSLSSDDTEKTVKTYVDAAPDDVDDEDTYAVVDTSSNDVTIYTGDEFEDADEIDATVNANAGWIDQFTAYNVRLLGISMPEMNIL